MSAVYPTIEDWDAFVRSLVPAPSAIGVSEDVVQAYCWPWSLMEQGIESLVVGLVDLSAAVSWVLDVAGARVDEPRGGLEDTEYRRIVGGRRMAIGADGTTAPAWAVLLALAGSEDGRWQVIVGTSTTSLAVSAFTPTIPTRPYLLRAGAILRDSIPLSAEAEAVLRTVSTMVWGSGTWGGSSTWGYSVPVE